MLPGSVHHIILRPEFNSYPPRSRTCPTPVDKTTPVATILSLNLDYVYTLYPVSVVNTTDDKYMLFDHIIRQTFMQSIKFKVSLSGEFSMKNLGSLIIAVCDYLTQLNRQICPTDLQFKPVIETQVQSQYYEILLKWIKPLQTDFENLNPSSELTV